MANKEQRSEKKDSKVKKSAPALTAPAVSSTTDAASAGSRISKGRVKRGSTAIRKCSSGCTSAFQDEMYGKGNRVHNIGGTETSAHYHCTVCGNVVK